MKVQKLAIMLVLASLSAAGQAMYASNNDSDTVSVVGHSGTRSSDNGGRQLASLAPSPASQIGPNLVGHIPPSISKAASKQWKVISSQLPVQVDEACDYCVVTANKMSKVADTKAQELTKWVNKVTGPAGNSAENPNTGPYKVLSSKELRPIDFNNRLWYMPDGRLKTMVPQ
jgi:hypothetical protein